MLTRQARMRAPVVLAVFALACWWAGCAGPGSRGEATGRAKIEAAPGAAKGLTLDLGGGVAMNFAAIPAGKFMMGSPDSEKGRAKEEGPQHEVTLSQPFYMSATEVTQAQYAAVTGDQPPDPKEAAVPATGVSWEGAVAFCRKLSEKTGKAVRLPTEAEWEYACRAGTQARFSFGDADGGLGDYAWYGANSGFGTHPAGQRKPSAWGLYDMHGNVGEWCADWFGPYPAGPVTDPQGPPSGKQRIVRGGSWYYPADGCRAANRIRFAPGEGFPCIGFRVMVAAK